MYRPDRSVISRERVLLGLLLLVAAAIRLASIHFGLPALNDPDELMFELGAFKMISGATLNPGWFGHPATTTMYVLVLVDIAVFAVGNLIGAFSGFRGFADAIYLDPGLVILPGRIAMLLFGLGTLVLACRLGDRLFGKGAGLIAAALLALSPVHVQFSQIVRSDMMACFFMLAAMLAAARICAAGKRRDYLVGALCVGLAVATKWPFALAALAIIGSSFYRNMQFPQKRHEQALNLLLFLVVAVLALAIVSPYLVIDFTTVIENLRGESEAQHLGATGGSPGWNLLWYFRHALMPGIGLAGLAAAMLGGWLAIRQRRAGVVLLPVATGFLLVLVGQNVVWTRWALPLLPIVAILAGGGFVWAFRRISVTMRTAAAIIAMALVALPLAMLNVAQARERMDDTRQRAARWATANIAPGNRVLMEHFAFDLVSEPFDFLFPMGDAGCIDARALLQGKVSYKIVERARGARDNVDYGTMSSAREAGCALDYAILTQFDRYRAEQERFPLAYARYQRLLARGRIVASFYPEPGSVGGPTVRIVKFIRTPAAPAPE